MRARARWIACSEFDATQGVVRIGRSAEAAKSPDAIVLPLAAHARDALTALFYVRTLPLASGARYRLPLNDGGRNSILEVSVAGLETIVIRGQSRQALRIDPRIEYRVARRAAPSAVVWLAAEASHLPLAVEVDALFGRVRMELTEYEAGSLPELAQ